MLITGQFWTVEREVKDPCKYNSREAADGAAIHRASCAPGSRYFVMEVVSSYLRQDGTNPSTWQLMTYGTQAKEPEDANLEELQKARRYLDREIRRLEDLKG